jgi:large subunit ribosomal protein L22e
LQARIKVGGKTGVLGDDVTLTKGTDLITVSTKVSMAKRYLKYLLKKFLKKFTLRDYIRVIAKGPNGYFLRFFSISKEVSSSKVCNIFRVHELKYFYSLLHYLSFDELIPHVLIPY